jgi:dihydroorotate dehydrogenase (fumarate)
MVDLGTRYMGLELRSPLVASASPLSGHLETLMRLEDAGAAAVVMQSLFEEQIEHEAMDLHRLLEEWSETYPEALSYLPDLDDYNMGTGSYLQFVEAARQALGIPVIASLNGSSPGGWLRYARQLQDAGADAIELNVYFVAADPNTSAGEVEARYLDLVTEVRRSISIPLAVKIGPFFSAMANMAVRLVGAGADGLVLFNRFYQPDFDLETLQVVPHLVLSNSNELRLPLRWIAILYGRIGASLAATTGVHTAEDAMKVLLAGADVAMMTSALLINGPGHIRVVEDGMVEWMEAGGYESVSELRGSMSQQAVPDPSAFERANYMQMLTSYSSSFLS